MNKKLPAVILIVLGIALFFYFVASGRFLAQSPGVKSPTPTPQKAIPEGWETYSSEKLGYQISFPESFEVEQNGEYSITILKPMTEPGVGPANFIYVSVVPEELLTTEGEVYNFNNSQLKLLRSLEVGESVSLASGQPDLDEWFTYTRVDNTEIDTYPTKRFENIKPWEFPGGTAEVRYVFETEGKIYILGYYYGGNGVTKPLDAREAHEIVTSFRLN